MKTIVEAFFILLMTLMFAAVIIPLGAVLWVGMWLIDEPKVAK